MSELREAYARLLAGTRYDRPEPGTRIRVHPDMAAKLGLEASEHVTLDPDQPTWLIERETWSDHEIKVSP